MILSQTAVYALQATLCLAARSSEERVRVDDVAEALDLPRNYLSKILHTLAREGVLSSARGPGGGFALAHPASDLTLAAVIEHFDGLPDASGCLLGRPECSDLDPCAAHARWKSVAHSVREFFAETTIADLTRMHSAAKPEVPR